MANRKFICAASNVWDLWFNADTYIFKNCPDAILGLIVLITLPVISLFFVIRSGSNIFSSYGFPIISISFAAIYDAYGRYVDVKGTSKEENIKKLKNVIRVFAHFFALLTSLFFCGNSEYKYLTWIPYIFLIFSALVVSCECMIRIKYSFLISFGGRF